MDWVNISVPEGFAGSKPFEITTDGSPLGLGSVEVSAVIKPDQGYEDDDEAAYQLSEGDGVTIVDASAGSIRLAFPSAISQAPSTWFYRIDVGLGDDSDTAIAGWITVTDT